MGKSPVFPHLWMRYRPQFKKIIKENQNRRKKKSENHSSKKTLFQVRKMERFYQGVHGNFPNKFLWAFGKTCSIFSQGGCGTFNRNISWQESEQNSARCASFGF